MGKNSGAVTSLAGKGGERRFGSRKTRDARAIDVPKHVEKVWRAGGAHVDQEH
jgi:hypothetical protein